MGAKRPKSLEYMYYICMSEELYYIYYEPGHCVLKQIFQALSTLLYTAPLFSLLSFLNKETCIKDISVIPTFALL